MIWNVVSKHLKINIKNSLFLFFFCSKTGSNLHSKVFYVIISIWNSFFLIWRPILIFQYTQMRLPNILEHETVSEAIHASKDWESLLRLNCHPDTQVLKIFLLEKIDIFPEIFMFIICTSMSNANGQIDSTMQESVYGC